MWGRLPGQSSKRNASLVETTTLVNKRLSCRLHDVHKALSLSRWNMQSMYSRRVVATKYVSKRLPSIAMCIQKSMMYKMCLSFAQGENENTTIRCNCPSNDFNRSIVCFRAFGHVYERLQLARPCALPCPAHQSSARRRSSANNCGNERRQLARVAIECRPGKRKYAATNQLRLLARH